MGGSPAKLSKSDIVWCPDVPDPSPMCGVLPGPAGHWLALSAKDLNNTMCTELLGDAQKQGLVTSLTRLDLSSNAEVSEVPLNIVRFTNLRSLDLRRTSVCAASLSAIREMPLEELDISECGITLLDGPLPVLSSLRLGASPLANLGHLSCVSNLQKLFLYELPPTFTDLQGFPHCPFLRYLDLDCGHLVSFSGLPPLDALEVILARSNKLQSLVGLPPLPSLTALRVHDNDIADIKEICNVPNLKTLNLNENSLDDLSALRGMESLSVICVESNPLTAEHLVSVLVHLPKLSRLACRGMDEAGSCVVRKHLSHVSTLQL